ncbi:Bifunctional oligoribonuclease and PAP phosphatase NrnA [compost metagenome]
MERLLSLIQKSENIVLSTHRQCDGDGLGAELALYFALKKIHKKVRVINVDSTPKKYRFLSPDQHIGYYEENPTQDLSADLVLIFDTNDSRLLEPLYSALKQKCDHFAFIDHHSILKKGPVPTADSIIDTSAASTGELVYKLIQALNIPLDREIARCIYTSITFDTQLYRFIRNSPTSHLIAAELLKYDINPEEVHRYLFAHQTVNKMAFLAKALGQIEYHCDGKLAVLRLHDKDLFHYNLEPDESRDVIDMLMNIEGLEAAVMFREDAPSEYKVSLRSKGQVEVLNVAESLGGGGHKFAAGAFAKGTYAELKDKVVKELTSQLSMLR